MKYAKCDVCGKECDWKKIRYFQLNTTTKVKIVLENADGQLTEQDFCNLCLKQLLKEAKEIDPAQSTAGLR